MAQAQTPPQSSSPSDYAALMREVRNSEGMKLEIRRLQMEVKEHLIHVGQLEPEVAALRAALQERDTIIE